MEEILRSTFKIGQQLKIQLACGLEPLCGTLLGLHPGVIIIRTDSGEIRLTRIEYIIDCQSIDLESLASDTTTATTEKITIADNEPIQEEQTPDESEEVDVDEYSENRIPPIFNNTPVLSAPTVVGKINLDEINDPRGKKRVRFAEKAEDEELPMEEESEETSGRNTDNRMMPANGYVIRLRDNDLFGFIQSNNENEPPIYFHRNEILLESEQDTCPHDNDPVIFTIGHNAKGTVAKCVHRQCTVGRMYELIDKISDYDPRNTKLLRLQLRQSGLVEDTEDDDEYNRNNEYGYRHRQPVGRYSNGYGSSYGRPYENRRQQQTSFCPFMEKEKWASRSLGYDEYMAFMTNLIEECQDVQPKRAYPLYTRVIKTARENYDEEKAYEFIDKALDFYTNEEDAGVRSYFERLKDKIAFIAKLREEEGENTSSEASDNDVDNYSAPVTRAAVEAARVSERPEEDRVQTGETENSEE